MEDCYWNGGRLSMNDENVYNNLVLQINFDLVFIKVSDMNTLVDSL